MKGLCLSQSQFDLHQILSGRCLEQLQHTGSLKTLWVQILHRFWQSEQLRYLTYFIDILLHLTFPIVAATYMTMLLLHSHQRCDWSCPVTVNVRVGESKNTLSTTCEHISYQGKGRLTFYPGSLSLRKEIPKPILTGGSKPRTALQVEANRVLHCVQLLQISPGKTVSVLLGSYTIEASTITLKPFVNFTGSSDQLMLRNDEFGTKSRNASLDWLSGNWSGVSHAILS